MPVQVDTVNPYPEEPHEMSAVPLS